MDIMGNMIPSFFPPSNEWSNDIKVHEKCILENGKVFMDSVVYEKIRILLFNINTEWLGYLMGEVNSNVAKVTDIFIPQQEVSHSSVKVKEDNFPEGIIGTVHSHHSMGSFVSGTDRDFLVGNHPLTIIVSYDKMMSKMRVLAPCGAYMLLDAEVEVRDSDNLKTFLYNSINKLKGPERPKMMSADTKIVSSDPRISRWINKTISGIKYIFGYKRENLNECKTTPTGQQFIKKI